MFFQTRFDVFLEGTGIPLFGKEGLGEVFGGICLVNYVLLSNFALVFE